METYICESGMKFGPFPADTVIKMEKIPQYLYIQQNMIMSEFIFYEREKHRLVSIEAKTTAPNPESKTSTNPAERFKEYIIDIREKFENSLDLYVNMALKEELPKVFENIDYSSLEIVFVLVIKNHKKEWLKDVKDAMEMAVRSIIRTNSIWKCKVLVINEEMAKRKQLIAG